MRNTELSDSEQMHVGIFVFIFASESAIQIPIFPGDMPMARADHSCNMWRYCDDGVWKDLMVLFGGSTDEGLCNDVWLFDFKLQRSAVPFPDNCTRLETRFLITRPLRECSRQVTWAEGIWK